MSNGKPEASEGDSVRRTWQLEGSGDSADETSMGTAPQTLQFVCLATSLC